METSNTCSSDAFQQARESPLTTWLEWGDSGTGSSPGCCRLLLLRALCSAFPERRSSISAVGITVVLNSPWDQPTGTSLPRPFNPKTWTVARLDQCARRPMEFYAWLWCGSRTSERWRSMVGGWKTLQSSGFTMTRFDRWQTMRVRQHSDQSAGPEAGWTIRGH